jgi:protein phosphatase
VVKTTRRLVGQVTDRGRIRETNEDRVCVFHPSDPDQATGWGSFYAVADGMGGHDAGAVAADRAIRKAVEEYYAGAPRFSVSESLTRAVQAANRAVRELGQTDPKWKGIGTTFVGAVARGSDLVVANVGDSRAYVIHDGAIRCLTKDHSWVAEQVHAGKMTPEQARVDRRRNLITRSLGTQATVVVDLFEETLEPDDVLVLCSDGLYGLVEDHEIGTVASQLSPPAASEELARRANDRGGTDNISVVVVGPPRRELAVGPGGRPPLPLVIAAILGISTLLGALAAVLTIERPSPAPVVDAVGPAAARAVVLSPPAIRARSATPTPVREASSSSPSIMITAPQTEVVNEQADLPRGAVVPPTATLVPPTDEQAAVSPTPATSRASPTSRPRHPAAAPTPEQLSATPLPAPTRPASGALVLNPVTYPPGSVLLSWTLTRGLGSDETFDVRAWRPDEPANTSIANTSDPSYAIGGSFPTGDYSWTIAVIRIPDKSTVVDASQTSTFHWVPSSGSNSAGSPDIGKRSR